MTLLVTLLAAVAATIIWYGNEKARTMKIGTLCYLYWGASLMWLVDAIFEYIELRAQYFSPAPQDMLNDLFLGLSVIALGLVIWIVVLLVKDPQGIVRHSLKKSR